MEREPGREGCINGKFERNVEDWRMGFREPDCWCRLGSSRESQLS